MCQKFRNADMRVSYNATHTTCVRCQSTLAVHLSERGAGKSCTHCRSLPSVFQRASNYHSKPRPSRKVRSFIFWRIGALSLMRQLPVLALTMGAAIVRPSTLPAFDRRQRLKAITATRCEINPDARRLVCLPISHLTFGRAIIHNVAARAQQNLQSCLFARDA